MIAIMGKYEQNNKSIEWKYIYDDDCHFIEDKYEGDYSFCDTLESARTTFNYFVKRVKVNGKWTLKE